MTEPDTRITAADAVISVESVSKHFGFFRSPTDRLKLAAVNHAKKILGQTVDPAARSHIAVRDVSFQVPRGETTAIIGRNGSGKSTLLQMICGTLSPTSGTISVQGRVAALLELGAGFNPEYSGRQNAFLNAAILGLSNAEIKERFDDIASFADIGPFMDMPVKTYSSGMYVRLAFAVAINSVPDILVIDEALAVGDEAFQRKCFAKIQSLQALGTTILFVSHSAQSVIELCQKALLLEHGELLMEGAPTDVTSQYQRLIHSSPQRAEEIRSEIRSGDWKPAKIPKQSEDAEKADNREASLKETSSAEQSLQAALELEDFIPDMRPESTISYDSTIAEINEARIVNSKEERCNILVHGQSYRFCYRVRFKQRLDNVVFAMMIKSISGVEIFGLWSHKPGNGVSVSRDDIIDVDFRFDNIFLPGTYFLNAGVFSSEQDFKVLHRIVDAEMFKVPDFPFADVPRGFINPRAIHPERETDVIVKFVTNSSR